MNNFISDIFFLVIILLVLTPIIIISTIFQKRKERYLLNLGKKFELEYKKGEQIDLMKGFRSRLFKYNKTIAVREVFVGEYEKHKFTIFTKLFYSSKSFGSNNFTIASCEFGETEFPYILLKSKKIPLHQNSEKNDTKIFLEESYLRDFDLYCPKDYEIEVLQIFTEELISSVQKISGNFSIEFGGNRFYVYVNKNIHRKRNEDDFAKILNILRQIIEKTDGLLFRLKDDFEVLDEYYKK